ncbi:VCBS repeat-containing protein [Ravibacter arvi]|uniref:VCBS repeat-containing protein n=1 Tax=Ravibacter arvi TaxID=2051041 RepID=A0ABP8LN27_9BACT
MKHTYFFNAICVCALLFPGFYSPLTAQTPQFSAEVVDNQIDIGYGLAIGDVDGDALPDILLADKTEIVWYRNPGARDKKWECHIMAENLTKFDNVCIAARDINGDGRVEVAVGAQWNPAETNDPAKSGAVFYLVPPADPTQKWSPVKLYHDVTIHRMAWGKTPAGSFQLLVLPLHGRGNVDGAGAGVNWIAFSVPDDVRKTWKYDLLDTGMHLTHNFHVYENGKSLQAAVAGKEGVQIIEYKGSRWRATGKWLVRNHETGEVTVFRQKNGEVVTATIEPMHGTRLMVTQQDGKRTILTADFAQGHAIAAADFLSQGESQLVAGWRNPNKDKEVGVRLLVRENNAWQMFPLDDRIRMACEDLKVADLDLDGKPDVIASGRATLNVLIYWNDSQ